MVAAGRHVERLRKALRRFPTREEVVEAMNRGGELPHPFWREGLLLDAWGTAIRYEAAGDGKAYRLVSAGEDEVFETANVPPLGESYKRSWTETLDEDLVYEDGVWMRDLGDDVGLPPESAAIVQMRWIGSACQSFASQHENRFPRAESLDELFATPGMYRSEVVKEVDPWGNPYLYIVSGDRRSFRIVCTGRDGELHESSKLPPGSPLTRWKNDDIILEDDGAGEIELVEPL